MNAIEANLHSSVLPREEDAVAELASNPSFLCRVTAACSSRPGSRDPIAKANKRGCRTGMGLTSLHAAAAGLNGGHDKARLLAPALEHDTVRKDIMSALPTHKGFGWCNITKAFLLSTLMQKLT